METKADTIQIEKKRQLGEPARQTIPIISIIIPVYNDANHLRKCLLSVSRSTYTDYECIVVDDASTDETVAVAKEFAVKVLELNRNRGPSFARNEGARAASGDILFFTDADIEIHTDTLSKIALSFDNRLGVDAVIGSYDDGPGHPSFISQYKNLFHHYVHQNSNVNTNTFWGACGAVRRDVFLKVGGFDERYVKPAIEDIELGTRLIQSGYKIRLQKHIQVKHLKRWTFWGLFKADVFNRGIPWTQLILHHKVFPSDLNLRPSQQFCVALIYLTIFASFFVLLFFPESYLLSLLILLIGIIPIPLLNTPFYRFFVKKRGIGFAVNVFPMHLFYLFYCGLSFILGVIAYVYAISLQPYKYRFDPERFDSQKITNNNS